MFFLLGFVPGYVVSLILKMFGLLRVGEAAEIAGLDPTKVPVRAYPEGISIVGDPGGMIGARTEEISIMGFDLNTWNDIAGAMYHGLQGSGLAELIWTDHLGGHAA